MRKYFPLIMILVSTISNATTWVTLNFSNGDRVKIIDKDSISIKNEYSSYRMKSINSDGSVTISYFKSNCKNQTRTITKQEEYSNSNELIKTVVFHDFKYFFYVRDNDSRKLANIVCKNTYS